MHILILHAHPEPTSFNGALTRTACAEIEKTKHTVEISDLYAERFDPAAGRHDFTTVADEGRFHYQTEQALAAERHSFSPDIAREQDRFMRADLLIVQFPLWWGGPPAILKGWIDRVLAYGFGYVDGARFDKGLHKGKRALLSVTTGGTPQRFSEGDVYGPIEAILMPLEKLTFGYLGMEVLDSFVAYAAPRVDGETRERYLEAWAARLRTLLSAA